MPKGQTTALLEIFLITLFACLFILWFIQKLIITLNPFLLQNFSEYLHIIIFYISLTLAYIATYSAVEVDSPSLLIIMTIAQGGNNGFKKEELTKIIDDDLLVKPRAKDLLDDELVYLDSGKYKLTSKGFLMVNIFNFYRRLLNAQKGG